MERKRVTIYNSLEDQRAKRHGFVIITASTLSQTLSDISIKCKTDVKYLYLPSGGIIDDLLLIRDDDTLIIGNNNTVLTTPPSGDVVSEDEPLLSPSLSNEIDPTSFTIRKCTTFLSSDASSRNDWVCLNVGGKIFATSRATLTSDPSSMLARMFESDWFSATDVNGAYLIDRSPEYFEPLLNFLRHGKLILNEGINPQGVLEEAKFFNITKAIEPLESLVRDEEISLVGHMTRREFIKLIITTPSNSTLRCQGINLENVDLSNLDLRSINFKCANLRSCNLSNSDLSNCILERADLSYAILNGAKLQCVHMPRVNMEGACLKNCNMDSNLGECTNLEGANLKSAVFDNSQMNGINLRLASLKGASLRSCNLRYATMAGTDLENSDLYGCDLQHANLRSANLAGVNFDGITAPLHMSQTVNVNISSPHVSSNISADGTTDNN